MTAKLKDSDSCAEIARSVFPNFLNFFRNLTSPFPKKSVIHAHAVILSAHDFVVLHLSAFMDLLKVGPD